MSEQDKGIESIKIGGKDYTMAEARELYNELHLLFGEKETQIYPAFPYPTYIPPTLPKPFTPLEYPYTITYRDGTGTPVNPGAFTTCGDIGRGSSN